jgi:hypothetical protein
MLRDVSNFMRQQNIQVLNVAFLGNFELSLSRDINARTGYKPNASEPGKTSLGAGISISIGSDVLKRVTD